MRLLTRVPPLEWLCLFALFLWLAGQSYPSLFDALSNNYREIQTYNLDTMANLRAAQEGLASPWFHVSFSDYGHFYFNFGILAAWTYSQFLPLTERAYVIILRLISLLGGGLTIGLAFMFARRFLGRIEAVFTATILAFSPGLVEFSTEVHPDTWQIFFLTLSVYYLARAFEASAAVRFPWRALKADMRFTLASSAAAGAAFGTKYEGILLIPLLVFAGAKVPVAAISERAFALISRAFAALGALMGVMLLELGRIAYPLNVLLFLNMPEVAYLKSGGLYWMIQGFRVVCFLGSLFCFVAAISHIAGFGFGRYHALLKRINILAAVCLAFAGAFIVSSPWLLDHLMFLRAIYSRSSLAGGGEQVGFRWLTMLANPVFFFSYGVTAMAVFGGMLLIGGLWGRDVRPARLPLLLVLTFLAIFLGFMIAKINYVTSVYLLPAVPLLALLAAFGLHEMRTAHWLGPRHAAIAVALGAVLILAQAWQGGAELMRYPNLVTALSPQNRMLGDWLTRCVPADARILAAAYSYAPLRFANVTVNMGPQLAYLVKTKPDLVTINAEEAARYYRDGKDLVGNPAAPEAARFFNAMLRSGAWRPGPSFGPFQVYVKASRPIADISCR